MCREETEKRDFNIYKKLKHSANGVNYFGELSVEFVFISLEQYLSEENKAVFFSLIQKKCI